MLTERQKLRKRKYPQWDMVTHNPLFSILSGSGAHAHTRMHAWHVFQATRVEICTKAGSMGPSSFGQHLTTTLCGASPTSNCYGQILDRRSSQGSSDAPRQHTTSLQVLSLITWLY